MNQEQEVDGIECSVIVPIYNDGYMAAPFCEQINIVMKEYLRCESLQGKIEVIFVNDGSRDNSLEKLLSLKNEYPFVRIINLSRNFGQHHAIACGYTNSRGKTVVRINVDMQDHPTNIPMFFEELKKRQCDLVIGQYRKRKSPWFSRLTSHLYFKLFRQLTDIKMPRHTSALRVMSRRYIENYKKLKEHGRFPQGLDLWLGFKCNYVDIDHCRRSDKRSSYTFFSRLNLAIDGLLYFTDKPLKLITYTGFILAFLGFGSAIFIVIEKLFGVVTIPGYASIMSLGLFAFGIQLTITGIVGLYTAKIFTEVKGRPLYIIEEEY